MPITRPVTDDETREMRLFSKLIEARTDGLSLPQFIASRRFPGEDWRSWEEIVFDLGEMTGELVTDVSLRKWAKRYGIPEDSTKTSSPAEFRKALVKAGIEI